MGGSELVSASTHVLDASQEPVADGDASCFSGDEQPIDQSTPLHDTRSASHQEPDRAVMGVDDNTPCLTG
jgi:hypothetical protein